MPLDGTTADLATTSVLAQGSGGGMWGTVARSSLVALVAVVRAGRRRSSLFVAKAAPAPPAPAAATAPLTARLTRSPGTAVTPFCVRCAGMTR